MPKFDGSDSVYTQLIAPARGDVIGVVKDISEALAESQTKFAVLEDLVKYGAFASKVLSVTATGTVTLLDTDPIFVEIDPNGSDRDVTFPAKGSDNHGYFVHHVGAANTLTLKRSGGATITTLAAGENKYIKPSVVSDFSALTAAASGSGGDVPNCLINGGFNFFQRVTPETAKAMSDDVYNAPDRWYSLVQGANATINRNAGIGTSQYSCKLVAGGTTNRYGIAQIVEANTSIPFRGKTVIAQCRLKPNNNAGSGTRKYRIAILEWTGTKNAVISELVADWTSGTFTTAGFFSATTKILVACASVTATHNVESVLSVSGAVSASCNNLIVFIWVEDVPTHASDYVLIGEAGLYKNGTAVEWTPRSFTEELLLCQRYYWKSLPVDTAPVAGCGVWSHIVYRAYLASTYQASVVVGFPVSMFATPALTLINPISANTTWRNQNLAADSGASGSDVITTEGFSCRNAQVAGDRVGDPLGINAIAEAEL